MARAKRAPLDTGAPVPELEVELFDGGRFSLPGDLAGRGAVLLGYRGHW